MTLNEFFQCDRYFAKQFTHIISLSSYYNILKYNYPIPSYIYLLRFQQLAYA